MGDSSTTVEDSIRIVRRERGYRLDCAVHIARPLERVFPFFADAANLQKLTPGHLRFEILTPPPIEMRPGLLIDYRLRLFGVPFRWQSEISVWEPPHRLVDEQRRGPYRSWHHEHSFADVDGETVMFDRVDYEVRGGGLAHALFVRRSLRGIFTFRMKVLTDLFGAVPLDPAGRTATRAARIACSPSRGS